MREKEREKERERERKKKKKETYINEVGYSTDVYAPLSSFTLMKRRKVKRGCYCFTAAAYL